MGQIFAVAIGILISDAIKAFIRKARSM